MRGCSTFHQIKVLVCLIAAISLALPTPAFSQSHPDDDQRHHLRATQIHDFDDPANKNLAGLEETLRRAGQDSVASTETPGLAVPVKATGPAKAARTFWQSRGQQETIPTRLMPPTSPRLAAAGLEERPPELGEPINSNDPTVSKLLQGLKKVPILLQTDLPESHREELKRQAVAIAREIRPGFTLGVPPSETLLEGISGSQLENEFNRQIFLPAGQLIHMYENEQGGLDLVRWLVREGTWKPHDYLGGTLWTAEFQQVEGPEGPIAIQFFHYAFTDPAAGRETAVQVLYKGIIAGVDAPETRKLRSLLSKANVDEEQFGIYFGEWPARHEEFRHLQDTFFAEKRHGRTLHRELGIPIKKAEALVKPNSSLRKLPWAFPALTEIEQRRKQLLWGAAVVEYSGRLGALIDEMEAHLRQTSRDPSYPGPILAYARFLSDLSIRDLTDSNLFEFGEKPLTDHTGASHLMWSDLGSMGIEPNFEALIEHVEAGISPNDYTSYAQRALGLLKGIYGLHFWTDVQRPQVPLLTSGLEEPDAVRTLRAAPYGTVLAPKDFSGPPLRVGVPGDNLFRKVTALLTPQDGWVQIAPAGSQRRGVDVGVWQRAGWETPRSEEVQLARQVAGEAEEIARNLRLQAEAPEDPKPFLRVLEILHRRLDAVLTGRLEYARFGADLLGRAAEHEQIQPRLKELLAPVFDAEWDSLEFWRKDLLLDLAGVWGAHKGMADFVEEHAVENILGDPAKDWRSVNLMQARWSEDPYLARRIQSQKRLTRLMEQGVGTRFADVIAAFSMQNLWQYGDADTSGHLRDKALKTLSALDQATGSDRLAEAYRKAISQLKAEVTKENLPERIAAQGALSDLVGVLLPEDGQKIKEAAQVSFASLFAPQGLDKDQIGFLQSAAADTLARLLRSYDEHLGMAKIMLKPLGSRYRGMVLNYWRLGHLDSMISGRGEEIFLAAWRLVAGQHPEKDMDNLRTTVQTLKQLYEEMYRASSLTGTAQKVLYQAVQRIFEEELEPSLETVDRMVDQARQWREHLERLEWLDIRIVGALPMTATLHVMGKNGSERKAIGNLFQRLHGNVSPGQPTREEISEGQENLNLPAGTPSTFARWADEVLDEIAAREGANLFPAGPVTLQPSLRFQTVLMTGVVPIVLAYFMRNPWRIAVPPVRLDGSIIGGPIVNLFEGTWYHENGGHSEGVPQVEIGLWPAGLMVPGPEGVEWQNFLHSDMRNLQLLFIAAQANIRSAWGKISPLDEELSRIFEEFDTQWMKWALDTVQGEDGREFTRVIANAQDTVDQVRVNYMDWQHELVDALNKANGMEDLGGVVGHLGEIEARGGSAFTAGLGAAITLLWKGLYGITPEGAPSADVQIAYAASRSERLADLLDGTVGRIKEALFGTDPVAEYWWEARTLEELNAAHQRAVEATGRKLFESGLPNRERERLLDLMEILDPARAEKIRRTAPTAAGLEETPGLQVTTAPVIQTPPSLPLSASASPMTTPGPVTPSVAPSPVPTAAQTGSAIASAAQLRSALAEFPHVRLSADVTSQRVLIVTPDGLPKLSVASVFVSPDREKPLLIEALANDAAHQQRIRAGLESLGLKNVRVHDVKAEFGGNVGEAITSIQIGHWQQGQETLVVTAMSGLEEVTRFLGVPEAASGLEELRAIIDRSQSVWS